MVILTHSAVRALLELVARHDNAPVRISLLTGGCGIQFFGVAPDRARAADTVIDKDGLTFLVESTLLDEYGTINIDSDGLSFRLSAGHVHPPSACGSCPFGCTPRGKQHCDGICRRCPTPCLIGRKKLNKNRNINPIGTLHLPPERGDRGEITAPSCN